METKTVAQIIELLDKFPKDMPLVLMDVRKCIHHASEEPTARGIYENFKIYPERMLGKNDEQKNVLVISFMNDDYDNDGNFIAD